MAYIHNAYYSARKQRKSWHLKENSRTGAQNVKQNKPDSHVFSKMW
jgi:hypothetical protein